MLVATVIPKNIKIGFFKLIHLNQIDIIEFKAPNGGAFILYQFENHMILGQIERAIGGNNNSESLRKKLYRYLKSI